MIVIGSGALGAGEALLAVAEAQIEAGEFSELTSPEDIRRLFDDIDWEVRHEAGPERSGSR